MRKVYRTPDMEFPTESGGVRVESSYENPCMTFDSGSGAFHRPEINVPGAIHIRRPGLHPQLIREQVAVNIPSQRRYSLPVCLTVEPPRRNVNCESNAQLLQDLIESLDRIRVQNENIANQDVKVARFVTTCLVLAVIAIYVFTIFALLKKN